MPDSDVLVDGRQLAFPGTGLAVVTSEILRSMADTVESGTIRVFVEEGFQPSLFGLERTQIQWLGVTYNRRSPDYLDRISWSRAVRERMRRDRINGRFFVPYLYNYGRLRSNVVLIPDLVYRDFPDYGSRAPSHRRWRIRGNLPFRPMVRRWEERRAAAAARIVVYSEFVRKQVHDLLRVPLDRIDVIALAAPIWISQTPEVRPDFAVPRRFALYSGGYAARKNVPMLLRACGRVQLADPSFRCVFAGLDQGVSGGNTDLMGALGAPGVADAAIQIGHLTNSNLAWAYRYCEFALYPSHSEGFGLPVVEAAACVKLCLCGDNSSMREVQPNPDYRISSSDEDAWVERILSYWRNPERAVMAGQESQKFAASYDWRTTAQKLWRILSPKASAQ